MMNSEAFGRIFEKWFFISVIKRNIFFHQLLTKATETLSNFFHTQNTFPWVQKAVTAPLPHSGTQQASFPSPLLCRPWCSLGSASRTWAPRGWWVYCPPASGLSQAHLGRPPPPGGSFWGSLGPGTGRGIAGPDLPAAARARPPDAFPSVTVYRAPATCWYSGDPAGPAREGGSPWEGTTTPVIRAL